MPTSKAQTHQAPSTKVRLGDLWCLGRHKLLCGDATQPESYARLLGEASVAMVFTDPPYNVRYKGLRAPPAIHDTDGPPPRRRGKTAKMLNDALFQNAFYDMIFKACQQIVAHCDGGIYICMANSHLHVLRHAFKEAGGRFSTFLIWSKNAFTLSWSDYHSQYEPILYGWPKGKQRVWNGGRTQSDVWPIKRPLKNDLHPTMKPVELVARAILNSSKEGDLVLDCFAGSGSTLMACEQSGRSARLMELDPKYCDVILKRWEDHSGEEALLEESNPNAMERSAA